jgi:anti-sigma factor RsiW
MSQVNDERLQRFFDGELTGDERAAVEKALAQPGDQANERLAALGQLRLVLDNTLSAEAADIDLWPALAARLDAADAEIHNQKQGIFRRWRTRARRAGYGSVSAGLAMAALMALLVVVRPWHPRHPENDCDVESLEVDGSMATVMSVNDSPHRGDGATTIIWAED